jgi:hypothetical protein
VVRLKRVKGRWAKRFPGLGTFLLGIVIGLLVAFVIFLLLLDPS